MWKISGVCFGLEGSVQAEETNTIFDILTLIEEKEEILWILGGLGEIHMQPSLNHVLRGQSYLLWNSALQSLAIQMDHTHCWAYLGKQASYWLVCSNAFADTLHKYIISHRQGCFRAFTVLLLMGMITIKGVQKGIRSQWKLQMIVNMFMYCGLNPKTHCVLCMREILPLEIGFQNLTFMCMKKVLNELKLW